MRRRLKYLAMICVSLLSLGMSAQAQSSSPSCPTVEIDCPTECYKADKPYTITARVTGADPKKNLTYNWSISRGVISSGQGTSSITVTEETACEIVTARVEVTGLDAECQIGRAHV